MTLDPHRPSRLRRLLQMLAAAVALLAAQEAAADLDPADPLYCLPVRGTATDGAPPLRLAPPPLSSTLGLGIGMAWFYRLAASGADTSVEPGGTGSPGLQQAPALVRMLTAGNTDLAAGRYPQAERELAACEKAAGSAGDSLAQAACANDLGLALAAQGRLEPARAALQRALAQYRLERQPPANVDAAVNQAMAPVLGFLGRLSGAQEQTGAVASAVHRQAVAQWQPLERIDAVRGIERTSLNLGNLAMLAGRLADAEQSIAAALEARLPGESPQCRASASVDWNRLQARMGKPFDASPPSFVPPKQASARRGGRRDDRAAGPASEAESFVEMGVVHVAVANAGPASAASDAVPTRMPERKEAQPALAYSESAGLFDDAVLTALLQEALRAGDSQTPAAESAWRRVAIRAAAGRRPDLEFAAHAALLKLYAARAEPTAAIYHGKRAIGLAQSQRAALDDRSPSRDARRAFARDRREVHVGLAQLLLDARRLAEAESVLQLLKEDEGQQFLDGPANLGQIELDPAERRLQVLDDETAQALRDAESRRVATAATFPIGGGALRSMDVAKIESTRLEQGLTLARLPELLRSSPLPGGMAAMDDMNRKVRDFFGQPGRLERWFAHLVEDAPSFDPPPSAADRGRLAEISPRLGALQAEVLDALKRSGADDDGPRVTLSRRGSRTEPPPRQVEWGYAAAETYEQMWRGIRSAAAIEARYVERPDVFDAVVAPGSRAASPSADTTALLSRQSVPTAIVYYLPSASRVDVLLVSAAGRRHVQLGIGMNELNADIDAFLAALRSPSRDPVGPARKLYGDLFAPLEKALADDGAQVIGLSLSGRLRDVPFGALYDGRGWLVERYAFAIHPGAGLAAVLKPATPHWRIAAFGATAGNAEFSPLAAVRSEIAGVVRQDSAGRGALPGDGWLDGAFTAQRLRTALGSGAQVVHIASHFKFVTGDAAASYLLLGDGSTLSLRELAGPSYRFDRTELVTLSACTTAPSSEDGYGQEVDGLAALLMGQGAPSVLASLWEINDGSTAQLMASFYGLHESRHLSRATALQQAQLALIHRGDANAPADGPRRSATRVSLEGDEPGQAGRAIVPASPEALGDAHPFYWAAFVLMGDWL